MVTISYTGLGSEGRQAPRKGKSHSHTKGRIACFLLNQNNLLLFHDKFYPNLSCLKSKVTKGAGGFTYENRIKIVKCIDGMGTKKSPCALRRGGILVTLPESASGPLVHVNLMDS